MDRRSPKSPLTFQGKIIRTAVQRSAATGTQLLLMDALRRTIDTAERREQSETEFVADILTTASKFGLAAVLVGTSETDLAFSLAAAPREPPAED